jgi:hypothetical protein
MSPARLGGEMFRIKFNAAWSSGDGKRTDRRGAAGVRPNWQSPTWLLKPTADFGELAAANPGPLA